MQALKFAQRDLRYERTYPGDPPDFVGTSGAVACRRGHFLHASVDPGEQVDPEEMCTRCGAPAVLGCLQCGLRIKSQLWGQTYKLPGFCDGCGAVYPWATREERIFELENLLDQEEIEDADRLFLHERLAELRAVDGSDQANEERLWKLVAQRGKALVSNPVAQAIINGLVLPLIRHKVGLP